MADKSPFLADQLAFYQTHTAKMMELQAARGKSAIDPSSLIPSSSMFDALMGAFNTGAASSLTPGQGSSSSSSIPAPAYSGTSSSSSSSLSPSSPSYTGNSPVSNPEADSSGLADTSSDWGIALGGAMSSHPGNLVGGALSLAVGNVAGMVKSLFGIGAETVASYQAIQALREPTVGENLGNNPTADAEAAASMGDTTAEAAVNYDSRVQQAPTGYTPTSTYENPYTPTSTYSNPYDTYFSNSSNPYSGYTTYGTSEGE